MATIRRNPMSTNTNSLSEQYMNFLEYKGLNTNKNYVSIDQETFTEVNNMYVNQENQLSTRPPEKIFVINSEWKVVKVWKINDKTFYHIQARDDATSLDPGTYYLACPASWDKSGFQLYETTQQIYLCWLNFAYCLFETDKITAIVYGQNKIDFYANDNAVYFPITKLHSGTEIYTVDNPDPTGQIALQQPNILTSGYKERYLFEPNKINPNTTELEDKTVTVKIGEDTYTIKWSKNNDKVFYKRIGKLSYNVKYYNVEHSNGVTVYVATEGDAGNESGYLNSYISVDGQTYYSFNIKELYDKTKTSTSLLCPLQLPVVDKQCKYIYAILYDRTVSTITLETSQKDIIKVYRKNIFQDGEISTFNSRSWELYQDITVEPTPNNETFPNKAIRIYYKNSSSANARITDYPLLGCAINGVTTYNKVTSFGVCNNDTFAFVISAVRNSFYMGNEDDVFYFESYLIAIGDGTRSDTKLFVRDISADAPQFKSTLLYASQNLVNKVYISMMGSTGLLGLSISGASIDMRAAANKYRIDNMLTVIDSNFKITGYYDGGYNSDSYDMFYKNTIYCSRFVPAIRTANVWLKYTYLYYPAEEAYVEANVDCFIESLTARFGLVDIELIDQSTVKSKAEVTNYKLSNIAQTADSKYYAYYYSNADGIEIRKYSEYKCDAITDKIVIAGDNDNRILDLKVGLNAILTNSYAYFINDSSKVPMLIKGKPIFINDNDLFIWVADDGTIYSNQYTETISVDNLVKGSIDYIMPEHSVDFITTCLSKGNVFYQSSKTLIDTNISEGKNLFYIPKNTKNDNIFTDKITQLVNFSQTALGIFLETTAYQLTYDSSNSVYYLSKTKLALGNRDGSDMLLSYDGNNIYITTLKGLSTLNYQDFVQSTEQIYRYLTEAIMDVYQEYATRPIKLCQYKNWLFLYKSTSPRMLVYDLRTSSWWVWRLPQIPKQLVYINDNTFTEDLVLVTGRGDVYKFNFDEVSVYDNELIPFDWSFTTQKMHFGAPNNYKHIRSVSIVTEQSGRPLRFKLKFTNYRNLNNLSDSDTVEYDIDQLTTMIKRVNFIKTNAFQLQVSNDNTDKYPQAFVTPNIAIKYRITERLR